MRKGLDVIVPVLQSHREMRLREVVICSVEINTWLIHAITEQL